MSYSIISSFHGPSCNGTNLQLELYTVAQLNKDKPLHSSALWRIFILILLLEINTHGTGVWKKRTNII